MKKLLSSILIISLVILSLSSCFLFEGKDSGKLRVGFMSGPTGMGMAKLIHDNGGTAGNEKYSFTPYTDASLAEAALTNGDIDVICLPTNNALNYYNTVDDSMRILAINCLNSLYLISDGEHSATSLQDLEGQTIYTCKAGTPRIILNYIISSLGLDIEVSYTINDTDMNQPADVRTQIIAGTLPYAVIPEPIVTASTIKNQSYSIDVNLADEWAKIEGLDNIPVAMGCIVTKQSVIDQNPELIKSFLAEYEASVGYIGNAENLENAANFVAEAKIMDAAPVAKKALKNLGTAISYIDGSDMKATLTTFYTAIGMKLPNDDFYYEK